MDIAGIAILEAVLSPGLGCREPAFRQGLLRRDGRWCRALATVGRLGESRAAEYSQHGRDHQDLVSHFRLLVFALDTFACRAGYRRVTRINAVPDGSFAHFRRERIEWRNPQAARAK
jgi:hypothetical protein